MALPTARMSLLDTAIVDRAAARLGQKTDVLMANAGQALAHQARKFCPHGTILVVCGSGNNGGDGYVCARALHEAGASVSVWPVKPPKEGLPERVAAQLPAAVPRLDRCPDQAPGLIVDCILGAGVKGAPRNEAAVAIRALRSLDAPVLAADVPSGLGSATVLPALATVTFQAPKIELMDAEDVGEVVVADIGILPDTIEEVQPECFLRFPLMDRGAHKREHGEILVMGGSAFPGALELTCRAALATGCDLVRAWCPAGTRLPPSIVTHAQPEPRLIPASAGRLSPLLARAGALLLGPGLGRDGLAKEAVRDAFALAIELGVPCIIDADAIEALSIPLANHPADAPAVVITPHRREAKHLLGSGAEERAMHQYARANRVLLAKGRVDLITDGMRWQRNHRGNPRMTVGGTGDLLSGLVAGLLARGAAPFDAARMAAYWLTSCADTLWQQLGPCYTPEDLLPALPRTLRDTLEPLQLWPPVQRDGG